MTNRRSTSRQLKRDLKRQLGQGVSRSLICRRLLERGINARCPRKKPRLTPRQHRLRREWAAVHRAWALDDWKTVLFSDESKISLGNDGCLYVWRRQGEELAPECCLQTVKHAASVMVWSSIAFNGVGSLHKIEGRLNAVGYQAILAVKMLADGYVLIGHNFVFQQDNSTIHTARSTLQWMGDNDVTVLDWLLCSPDVNPIENLWRDLKVAANAHHLREGEELWAAVQTAWTEMPGERMRTLVESIPHRTEGVRKTKGGNTKY